jgi:hypothetical protein
MSLLLFLTGCPSDDDDDDDNDNNEPQEVFFEEEIDNSFAEDIVTEVVCESPTLTNHTTGDPIEAGSTTEERSIVISGTVPDYTGLRRASDVAEVERISLHADGGSCMEPGPWNDEQTFTIGFTQTVSVSYYNQGISCLGSHGFTVWIKDATGATVWMRDYYQATGADVDQEEGSLEDLPPGTYTFGASAVTGTHTYATLTYTPGVDGLIGSTVVIYKNGEFYPVMEADPGETYEYTIDLQSGGNTIRILVIGNFSTDAVINEANIFAASDVFTITSISEELAIRIVLTWETEGDVDLHLIAPGGSYFLQNDCYFGNRNPDWGVEEFTLDNPMLDFDNTSGYGPETIVLPQPIDGLYAVVVHYYSAWSVDVTPTNVRVVLNEDDSRNYGPRSLEDENVWIVTGIQVDGGVASFAPRPSAEDLGITSSVILRQYSKGK